MTTKERYKAIIGWFEEHVPVAESELNFENAYQLIVAVVLSAQCTDKRVNQITPELFSKYPTLQDLAEAEVYEVFEYIRSVSYPNSKAGYLVGIAQKLVNDYNGEIPDEVDELIKLPGVGRKSASVVASIIYNKPAMAVDTHVFRISNRLGLTKNSKNVLETERTLIKHIPEALIPKAHHWLILHGRYICVARKPKCESCGLSPYCLYYSLNQKMKPL